MRLAVLKSTTRKPHPFSAGSKLDSRPSSAATKLTPVPHCSRAQTQPQQPIPSQQSSPTNTPKPPQGFLPPLNGQPEAAAQGPRAGMPPPRGTDDTRAHDASRRAPWDPKRQYRRKALRRSSNGRGNLQRPPSMPPQLQMQPNKGKENKWTKWFQELKAGEETGCSSGRYATAAASPSRLGTNRSSGKDTKCQDSLCRASQFKDDRYKDSQRQDRLCQARLCKDSLCKDSLCKGNLYKGQPMQGQPMPGQTMPGQQMQGLPNQGQSIPEQAIQRQSVQGLPIQGQSIPGQPMPGTAYPKAVCTRTANARTTNARTASAKTANARSCHGWSDAAAKYTNEYRSTKSDARRARPRLNATEDEPARSARVASTTAIRAAPARPTYADATTTWFFPCSRCSLRGPYDADAASRGAQDRPRHHK